jgi:hypothetical protein
LNATNANLGTARIDTLTVWTGATITNLSAPGRGANSLKIGADSSSDGYGTIVIGTGSGSEWDRTVLLGTSSTNIAEDSLVIGNFSINDVGAEFATVVGSSAGNSGVYGSVFGSYATNAFQTGTAIGYESETTATNQVRLGNSVGHVSVAGFLSVEGSITNALLAGTNTINGSEIHTAGTYTALVNSPGNNTAIDITTNTVIEMSGATLIANICSFATRPVGIEFRVIFSGAVTNKIVENSGAEGTTTRRIYTGVGDVNLTNTYSWAKFRRTSVGYLLLEHSN